MAVRWFNVPRGTRRYYVESVTGWPINPATGIDSAGHSPTTTWFVADSSDNHREVAVFEPRGGRISADCKVLADALCVELNRNDE